MLRHPRLAVAVYALLVAVEARSQEPEKLFVGPNVNMVSGTEFPGGDPFLQRQNEPSGAVSSRSELHLLAGANDYRAVDIPFDVPGPGGEESGGDSWLGVFFSTDGGSRWSSTLHPGYPQDPACATGTPPVLCQYQAGADPVVRAGTHGLFYYAGIVFDRGVNARSAVFVSRFMDLNNDEGGEPIRYVDTAIADFNQGSDFLDKPWIAVDAPRPGAPTVDLEVRQRDGTVVQQTVSCGSVYLAYAAITGSAEANDLRSQILFRSSHDCGTTWTEPLVLSDPDTLNQGAVPAVSPGSGDVYVAWRQFSSIQSFLGEAQFCAENGAYWRTHPEEWPVEALSLGGAGYDKGAALGLMAAKPKGDTAILLAQQLIPAKLNNFQGIDDGLSNVINQGDVWLVANPLGSKPKQAAKKQGKTISDKLEAFNQGAADPPQCGTPAPGVLTLDDAILVARSSGGGQSFAPAIEVATASPFDQGSTQFSFRSTAYPTMTVDAGGRAYVAWSERGMASPSPDPETGDSRIVLSTSADGSSWSPPYSVDPAEARGHQVTPSLLFAGGKLVLAHYDFRQDVSNVFEPFVIDMPVGDRLRHSVDVRVSIADPGPSPEFTDYSVLSGGPRKPSLQTSRYPFVVTGDNESDAETIQLQYMTPNIPLFEGGGKPFIGDYIDVIAKAFIREEDGTWRSASQIGDADTYHALWTDNRDVVPPNDGDWTSYVPPTLEGQEGNRFSLFDGNTVVPDCTESVLGAERTGMRNQNIYTALISRGLFLGAPGNTKPLGFSESELAQRSFVVFVQNVTDEDRRFRLSAGQPDGGDASFDQLAPQGFIDVVIPAFSSASHTVYLRAPDPEATALVLVTETDSNGMPKSGGLSGSVRLNPDPSSPAPGAPDIHTPAILNPAIFNPAILNPAILNPAIFNPAILNPAILNPAILNPAIFNPAIFNPAILNPAIFNPAIFNPAIFNPAILNPAIFNPAIFNPAILNPAILNPAIFNPAILNPAILNPAILNAGLDETSEGKDLVFAVRNDGTTTSAYDLNFNVGGQDDEVVYQLMVFKLNVTPIADGCQVAEEAQQQLLVNLVEPEVDAPRLLDGGGNDPHSATFSIEPGGQVFVTLRVLPDLGAGDPAVDWNEEEVSVAVVSQPVNSDDLAAGDVQPSFDVILAPAIGPLVIDPTLLPSGQHGVAYPAQSFTATGGSGTQVWSAFGSLPPGLALSAAGLLQGTPTSVGNFAFTARVTDAAQSAEQTFNVLIDFGPPFLDQFNATNDLFGPANGLYGQTFVPQAPNVARVELTCIVNQVPPGGVSATVGIFTDITEPPIATADTLVAAPLPGELRRTISFAFDPPVRLLPNTTYTVGFYAPPTMSWDLAFLDPYAPGRAVLFDGVPINPPADFVFATYAVSGLTYPVVPDQSNAVSDQLGLGTGLRGQTFVPSADNVVKVDLRLIVNNVPPGGVDSTIGIFTDITLPPIATAGAFIPQSSSGLVSYRFDPPVTLVPSTTYTIGLFIPPNVSWEFAFGNPYPQGHMVDSSGAANPDADFVFATSALPGPLFVYEGSIDGTSSSLLDDAFLDVDLRVEYRFDPGTLDRNPDGNGDFDGAVTYLRVILGSDVFTAYWGDIKVVNIPGSPDQYFVASQGSIGPPIIDTFGSFFPEGVAIVLTDSSETNFTGDALPLQQPDPGGFDGHLIEIVFAGGSFIRASVVSTPPF